MLKKNVLKKELQKSFEDLLPSALEQGILQTYSRKTKAGEESAKKFATTVTELLAEPLADSLAGAIDYHIRSAEVYGMLITTGSPGTHTCKISSPSPMVNGKMPNTLGIR